MAAPPRAPPGPNATDAEKIQYLMENFDIVSSQLDTIQGRYSTATGYTPGPGDLLDLTNKVATLESTITSQKQQIDKLKNESLMAGVWTAKADTPDDLKTLLQDRAYVDAMIKGFEARGTPKELAEKYVAVMVAGAMSEYTSAAQMKEVMGGLYVDFAKNHPSKILDTIPRTAQQLDLKEYLDLEKDTVDEILAEARQNHRGENLADTLATIFAVAEEGSADAREDLRKNLPSMMEGAYKALEKKNNSMIKDALTQRRVRDEEIDNFVPFPHTFGKNAVLRHSELRTILVSLSGKLYDLSLRERELSQIKPISSYLELASAAAIDNGLSEKGVYSLLLKMTCGKTFDFIKGRMEIHATLESTWKSLQRAEMKYISEADIKAAIAKILDVGPDSPQKIHGAFNDVFTLAIKLYPKVRDPKTKMNLAVTTSVSYFKKYLNRYLPLQASSICLETEKQINVSPEIRGTIEEVDLWSELTTRLAPQNMSSSRGRKYELLETRLPELSEDEEQAVESFSWEDRSSNLSKVEETRNTLPPGAIRKPMKCFLCAQEHGFRNCNVYPGMMPSGNACKYCHCKHLPRPCQARLSSNPNNLSMNNFNQNLNVNEAVTTLDDQPEGQDDVYLYYDDDGGQQEEQRTE